MPAKHRQQAPQQPSSPTSHVSSKYTNKDGSKFITVPKISSPTESSETSPAMAQVGSKWNGGLPGPPPSQPADSNGAVAVNRKKQKRRQKQAEQAAKLAAEQSQADAHVAPQQNGTSKHAGDRHLPNPYTASNQDRPYYSDEDDEVYSTHGAPSTSPRNGYLSPPAAKTSKKKKGKSSQHEPPHRSHTSSAPGSHQHSAQMQLSSQHPAAPLSPTGPPPQPGISREKIWNTSSQEERERIKAFWLSLGEEERRSLVKVEKDAVLKKMKEQQKHSCSCTVCGRKRIAIEEELEVLYDAYYEELEVYAHKHGDAPPPLMSASQRYGQLAGLQPPNRLPPAFNGRQPSRGRIIDHLEDDADDHGEEEGDEEYSDDDQDDEEYSEDEPPEEELPRNHASDFFNFGQSLTVQGGILTVADDLLKNDGKKFIEMMEQLAERRMAREEDAREQYANGYGHPANGGIAPHHHGHNHPPPPDEEEYDDEGDEDEDYDEDSQDEDYDEEEMDTMTEAQRMEEGRRMFQIFAARMFEQRVLSAYREKIAAERQNQLIEEEDAEAIAAEQKKAKKAKDAAKKKEKANQKKQALAEEKAKRESDKAAQEAAIREADEKKAEEARVKADEKRKKREAQKKADEEEKLKKESEKQRRLQEQRERQAEIERKAREAKERERKEKEEARQREKDAKEKEARERREEADRRKKESDAKTKVDKALKEQHRREEQPPLQPVVPTSIAKRPQPQVQVPIPAGVQSHVPIASPHIPVATPVLPKAPTPKQPPSIRDSNSIPQTPQVGSNTSKSVSPNVTPQHSSPGSVGHAATIKSQQPFLHHPQAASPIHSTMRAPPGAFPPSPFAALPPMGTNGFPPGMPMMAPGFGGRMHHDPMFSQQLPMGSQFRPPGPPGMPMHPGMNGMPHQQGRGYPIQHPPPGFPQQLPNGLGQPFGAPREQGQISHSRQQSASYEKSPSEQLPTTQPIARPAPIGRPASTVQGQRSENNHLGNNDVDDLSSHLGSSALLEDDEPMVSAARTRRPSNTLGNIGRPAFPQNQQYDMNSPFMNPLGQYPGWGASNSFGGTSLSHSGPYQPPGSNSWSNPHSTFGAVGGSSLRASQPRSVGVRVMLCNACKSLRGTTPDGFQSIKQIREQLERVPNPYSESISEREIMDLCETEGNPINGGGYFEVRRQQDGTPGIKWELDGMDYDGWTGRRVGSMPGGDPRVIGAPGEIGSPIVGAPGGGRFGGVGSPSGL